MIHLDLNKNCFEFDMVIKFCMLTNVHTTPTKKFSFEIAEILKYGGIDNLLKKNGLS